MLKWEHVHFNKYGDDGLETDEVLSEFWFYNLGIFEFNIYRNIDNPNGYRAMIMQSDNSKVLKVNNDPNGEHKVHIYLEYHKTFEKAETAIIDVFKNFYNMINDDYFKLMVDVIL